MVNFHEASVLTYYFEAQIKSTFIFLFYLSVLLFTAFFRLTRHF